jgi:hypothetical protein
MGHFVTEAAEGPGKEIVGNISPEVPYMGVIINRRAAAVESNLSGLERLENFGFPP